MLVSVWNPFYFHFSALALGYPGSTTMNITIPNMGQYPVMTVNNSWIIFQQRFDPTVTMNYGWTTYRDGFGDFFQVGSPYWMGLEKVYQLTNIPGSVYRLRLEYRDCRTEAYYMQEYSTFRIESESNRYKLRVSNASCTFGDQYPDQLNVYPPHNGQNFSTNDRADEDYNTCPGGNLCGWWFIPSGSSCQKINLNGVSNPSSFYCTNAGNGNTNELDKSRMMMLRVAWQCILYR